MDQAPTSLPTDVAGLTRQVEQQRETITELQAKLDHQTQFIEQLLEQIRLANQRQYGSHSERFNVDQLSLLFNEAEVLAAADSSHSNDDESTILETNGSESEIQVDGHTRKRGGRRRLPPELPRIEVIHDLAEADQTCPHDQHPLKLIGSKISEQLDIIPAKVQVIRNIRRQYACPHCEQTIKTAPLPGQPIPQSIASPGTLAHVAVRKFADGLPLYRQAQQLKRIDVHLPRSTLANWMIKAGELIQPLINLMRDTLLDYDILGMDETRLQVLKEPGKSPQSQSYLWVQRGGPPDQRIVLYDYDPSRSQEVPKRLLVGYKGYLQVDGYEGYNKVCAENPIIQVGCWAHVRRKFDEARKAAGNKKTKLNKPSLTIATLQRIQLLYRLERQLKDSTPEHKQARRQRQAVPILTDLRQWLDQHLPLVPPKSVLGKAMNYAHKQWDKLTVYTEDGRLHIDNNLTENAIRPFVVGRKAWLFCDTVAGANASANLYSLIETAKANGVESYAYLKTVFTELPKARTVDDIEALLPLKPKIKVDLAA